MVDHHLLSQADKNLRRGLQDYAKAYDRGRLLEVILTLHTGLEDAFRAHVGVASGEMTFNDLAIAVVPTYSNQLRSLNRTRSQLAHRRNHVSDADVRATASGFAQVTINTWHTLFSTSLPSLSHPPAAPPEQSKHQVEQSTQQAAESTVSETGWRIAWGDLFIFILLFLVTPWLAGLAYALWVNELVGRSWSLLIAMLVMVLLYFWLRSGWRFLRQIGFLRFLATVSIILMLSAIALALFGGRGTSLAERSGSGFARAVSFIGDATIGIVPSLFEAGVASSHRLPRSIPLNNSPTPSHTHTPLPPTPSPFPTSTSRIIASPTSITAKVTATPKVIPRSKDSKIAVGSRVLIETDGANLRCRSAPGLNHDVVARFPNGTKLRVIDGPVETDGYTWWKVKHGTASGWSAGDFLIPVSE